MPDQTGPRLTSLILPDIALDSYGAFTFVAATAQDESALSRIEITLDAPLGTTAGDASTLVIDRFSGDRGVDSYVLASDAVERTYHVTGVNVFDAAGNATSYTAAQLAGSGFATSFIVGPQQGGVDQLRPQLQSLNLPANIATTASGTTVNFGAYAQDVGQSGVARISFQLDRPLQTTDGSVSSLTFSPDDGTLASYGLGSIAERVTSATVGGTYHVIGASVADAAGNSVTYSAADLHALGLLTSFTVDDHTVPTLTAFALAPVDVTNGAASPQVLAQVADDADNAAQITVTVDRPLVAQGTQAHGLHSTYQTSTLTFGLGAGNSFATPVLDEQTRAGSYTITSVVVTDQAGNSSSYSTADLAARGFATSLTVAADSTAPTLTSFGLSSPLAIASNGYAGITFSVGQTDAGSTIGLVGAIVHLNRLGGTGGYASTSVEIDGVEPGSAGHPGYYQSGHVGQGGLTIADLVPGLYRVADVTLNDYAANRSSYDTAALRAAGDPTSFVVARAVSFAGRYQASDGYYAFAGGDGGGDRLVVNGNTHDYTLSRQAVPGAGSQVDGSGDFVLTGTTGGSIYFLDQSIEGVEFRNGDYLSLRDLPGAIAAGAAPGEETDDYDRLYQPALSGFLPMVGDASHHIAVLNGNAYDYTERAFTGVREPDGTQLHGIELLAANGLGNHAIFLDDSITSVQFLYGQTVSLADIGSVSAADHSATPNGMLHVVDPGVLAARGSLEVSGSADADDVLLLDQQASYYQLDRSASGAFVLTFGYQHVTVDQTIDTVEFGNGEYLALKDLPAHVTGDPAFTSGTDANDVLVVDGYTGDQYLIGGGGQDLAEIHGNGHDYVLRAVSAQAHDGLPAVDGVELLAINSTGNLYVDASTETVQWQDGGSTAYADLPGTVLGVAATGATDGHDVFIAAPFGDQYFNGGAGSDDLYLLGNTYDYTLQQVTAAATADHAAVTGVELVADNGSGNLFIDGSIETVHFQNGDVVAFNDLHAFIG